MARPLEVGQGTEGGEGRTEAAAQEEGGEEGGAEQSPPPHPGHLHSTTELCRVPWREPEGLIKQKMKNTVRRPQESLRVRK